MTTAGPKPDWYFDPDGGENERYWNGIEWTQHRRSRRPTVSQPPESFSHPADIVDPMLRVNARRTGPGWIGFAGRRPKSGCRPAHAEQQLEQYSSYDLGYQHGRRAS